MQNEVQCKVVQCKAGRTKAMDPSTPAARLLGASGPERIFGILGPRAAPHATDSRLKGKWQMAKRLKGYKANGKKA